LSLIPSKIEFFIFGLPQQLSKLDKPTIHLPNNQHISSISKSCFQNIRDLRRIRNTMYQTTACTIATSLIQYKIDYYNSILLNLPATQTSHLQLVQRPNSVTRAVTKTPKFHHITILKSLRCRTCWLLVIMFTVLRRLCERGFQTKASQVKRIDNVHYDELMHIYDVFLLP